MKSETISKSGNGSLEFARVAGRTRITGVRANSPLAILTPRAAGDYAWAVCGTLGGGFVAGDSIALDAHISEGATALISTQASTKVYRSFDGRACTQELSAAVENDGLLVATPDPVVCFAGANYRQRQRIELSGSGSVVLLDWFTSGRSARGERWLMNRYRSHTEVSIDGRLVLRDSTLLDADDGALADPMRLGRFDCYAILTLLGTKLAEAARAILDWARGESAAGLQAILFSVAPIADGVLLRAAGPSSASVGAWVRERLSFLRDFGVNDPWNRRH